MFQDPWFTILLVVIPLLLGATKKIYLSRKKSLKYKRVIMVSTDIFMLVMIGIYTTVKLNAM